MYRQEVNKEKVRIMVLDKLVFNVGKGVSVELKPELLVVSGPRLSGLFLPYVPTKISYENIVKERLLNFDFNRVEINRLEDFFAEGERKPAYDFQQVEEMAQIYSDLLHKGHIKIREGEFTYFGGHKEWCEYEVYPNLQIFKSSKLQKLQREKGKFMFYRRFIR